MAANLKEANKRSDVATSISNSEEAWRSYVNANAEKDGDGEAVAKAHKLDNPMLLDALIPLKHATLKNGKKATIEHFQARQLTPVLMTWVMDLMSRNMKKMYRKSEGGWKPKAKKKEMTEENSRYLIAFLDNKPIAFSHFQFDMDYDREVLYCYEIQVESYVRSCGLGRIIMEALEKIAVQASLPLVVLTVFKFNVAGLPFFKTLGYDTDETCPEEEEKKDYVILSKKTC